MDTGLDFNIDSHGFQGALVSAVPASVLRADLPVGADR